MHEFAGQMTQEQISNLLRVHKGETHRALKVLASAHKLTLGQYAAQVLTEHVLTWPKNKDINGGA